MKNYIKFLLSAALFLMAVVVVQGQERKRTTTRTQEESLGERINSMVNDFMESIDRELSFRTPRQDYIFSADTLEKRRIKKRTIDEELLEDEKAITKEGNTTVEKGDTVKSSLVVKAGTLTIYGVVEGDVMVVGGDLYVKEDGKVTGNAKVIRGSIVCTDGGTIDGYMDQSSGPSYTHRDTEKEFSRSSYRLQLPWRDEFTNLDNVIFRYNRVEGIFLGLGSEKRYYWDDPARTHLYGSVGWGFKSHRWRYNLGLSQQFSIGDGQIFEVGAEGHSFTDTKDKWIISLNENTAAALLIHEDYRDYFGRQGFGVNTGFAFQQEGISGQLKAEYLLDEYTSLTNRTEWSIFGGKKVFRPNPAIHDGKIGSVLVTGGFSTEQKSIYGPKGWNVYATAEFANQDLGGSLDFHQYVLDMRRYQPLSTNNNFNIRFRVGSAEGVLPAQKIFELGGLSSLHAFPYKAEAGNRMILVNAEFITDLEVLSELSFWPDGLLGGINLLVLTDAGIIRNVPTDGYLTSGFEKITFSEFKHDVGVGIANQSGTFRIAFVWRTDIREPAKFIFRFSRPF
ncbi:MAG: BamA/TamA family outer membrane protein [bacterium]